LNPDIKETKPGGGGAVASWGPKQIEATIAHFIQSGARALAPIRDVGEGIKVATVGDPFGNVIGLIENRTFEPTRCRDRAAAAWRSW
jgi:hypothetical protein